MGGIETKSLPVPDGLDGMRVDSGVARLLGLSRNVAATIAESGGILLNGTTVGKADILSAGSWLEVDIPEAKPALSVMAEPVPGMTVLYADDDLVVVDKPIGVAAHPSVGWNGPTVIGGLAAAGYRVTTSGPPERKGIVHRLDVGTSGCMIVALSEHAYTVLKQAFRDRTVEKEYHALVQGYPEATSGTIDAPIGHHHGNDWRFTVRADGKPSITHYDTIEAFRHATLLKVHLETGRTHQIRVHFSALHHPLVGDMVYGADPTLAEHLGLTRQWLHAVSVGFVHPTNGHWLKVESPYRPDLDHALHILRDGV